ncbi:unnamed protein product [Gongylonema pulchrum]|uniref:DDE Tnp4 domain-containing protein n=1 Tax=Gongylonema pulchrum TaxID=637853 RepID=A0A183E3H0_9BILA|nr:unnamed protein product [Gongylonema pulchrum]
MNPPFIVTHKDCDLHSIVNSFAAVPDHCPRYVLGDNLHIGLSNSMGNVFSYTDCGLIVEPFWKHSICAYNENIWNCYSFVMDFLQYADLLERNIGAADELISSHVCKALQRMFRYFSLLNCLSGFSSSSCFILA